MKIFLASVLVFCNAFIFAQEEVVSPLLTNTAINKNVAQNRMGNSIDSTFIYLIDTLDLLTGPVWDDFSVNKFEQYNANYSDGNVTSQYYYHLMDMTNTIPQNPTFKFCDSTHARIDTVSMMSGIGTTTPDYFTMSSVWVNDLSVYPVNGMMRTLYQTPLLSGQCYVIIDSIFFDEDPDVTVRDTIFYSPDFVQDSANVFTVTINDTDRIWVDNYAYHNYRYAVDPWSLGVATLDGVDENGWPYDWGNTSAHEKADVLTSKPIRLSGLGQIYLTFLYQAGGHGDNPEVNDSLILEWWLPDSNAWYPSQWKTAGGITNDIWDTAHWAIPPAAMDDGFRFRFRNWASTSGNLDHWHIDYVRLDSALTTTGYFNDLAISEPINSLLKDYTAVPWDHYKNADSTNVMIDVLSLKTFNSAAAATSFGPNESFLEIKYGITNQPASPFNMPNPGLGWTGQWEVGFTYFPYTLVDSCVYSQTIPTGDQAHFDVKVNLSENTSVQNLYAVNDTTYLTQKFDNYYSYDDGSAEKAYGITGSHGLLAYKFTAYEEDTLTGILMHFVPSVNDMSANVFLLTIWDDNAGVPGTIIYQDDYFNTSAPEYSGALNGFKYYTFQDEQSVKVPQTFYIGWEQIESASLNIGMDMNINNSAKIFRNVTGTWLASSQPGSLLMRPVFSTGLNYTLYEPEMEETLSISIYPNPTQNYFNINGLSGAYTVTLFDLSGRAVYQNQNENVIDVSYLNSGLYIVDIRDENGLSLYTGKIIKE